MTDKTITFEKAIPVQWKQERFAGKKPVRADDYSIGYDLITPMSVKVPGHSRMYVPMGFAISLPMGLEGKIEPRSGFSGQGIEGMGYRWGWKKFFGFLPVYGRWGGAYRFDCDVKVGKVDPGYLHEVHVIVKNCGPSFIIPRGTKLAQITFYRVATVQFQVTDVLHGYDRGGGLGHTGSMVQQAELMTEQPVGGSDDKTIVVEP